MPENPPQFAIDLAIQASLLSPCGSKRGASIWICDKLVITGYNHKTAPFICDQSKKCRKLCPQDAVHAEQHALLHAGVVFGMEMLHIKTVDGLLVPSMGPSCLQCSKLILASGIVGMWLFHHNGWKRYTATEFHYASGAYWSKAKSEAEKV